VCVLASVCLCCLAFHAPTALGIGVLTWLLCTAVKAMGTAVCPARMAAESVCDDTAVGLLHVLVQVLDCPACGALRVLGR
jgi:hypothetical protein